MQKELKRPFDFNSLRSSKLEALKGRTILARGKRDSGSAPPRVTTPQNEPLTANRRDSANLICGVPWFRLIAVLALCMIAFAASAEPSAPSGLLVNGVSNPLAIERDATRFTWMSKDTGRSEHQTAYQIVLCQIPPSADSGLQTYPGLIFWDSGKVHSDQSASVEYGGKALPAATRFWWKVRIWDQTGQAGPYSAPGYFDTGLNQGEWTAHYIWDGTTNQNNFAYFRKTFVVKDRPALATVYVTAHNDYLLYCNGRPLGRGPARCDPYHYGQYNAYDITELIMTGTNVFAAMGHWEGNWRDSGCNAKPAFLLEARLDYLDGSSSTVGTDQSWKVLAHTAFIETNATYFSGGGPMLNRAAIQFDSRKEPNGWQQVGFDDSAWDSAVEVDRSNYRLFAQMAPLEREQAELKPVSVSFTNGAWNVNFGRCIDGWPKITMRENHSGDKVRVEYFEMTDGRKPAGWDEYTCHGGGTETWDADFGRHTTFQVLKITGYAGKLRPSDIRGMWAYSDADVQGRFHCSSSLLNDIYEMCERSARQNIQEGMVSVDANREQSQWTADSWNIASVLIYNDRDTMMLDKIVRDYAGEQKSDGDFYACSPSPMFEIPEWSMYWPMLLWQQYLFSGDKTLLGDMSPHLTHFLEWMKRYQDPKTNLPNPPNWRITDWAPQLTPHGGLNAATSCQYYENLRIASRIFAVLGDSKQSDNYRQQAEQIKTAINAHLFNGEYYLARTDTNRFFPLASAWALRFNIEPEAEKSKIVSEIEQAGKVAIGGYGGDALYSGMLNADGGAFVVRDLARYRPMLESNKANWESWSGGDEVNHAWTAYPAYIFLKYICGIQPTSGGFATFDVRPSIGGLTFAKGTVPTVKGPVTTRWEKGNDGSFSLSVDVPANTRASIYIPKLSANDFSITESGKRLWPANSATTDPGVLSVSEEIDSIKCIVGGGEYRFREEL
ncbi:MAG TPA: family 78 glycoside hydrolase catalytic domain [Alphaproteobacteria bacterium]|nr:family 78 glycoside hydrolase catalytic domain [Alphaproteobacteria bacterium]